ncbi:uncharacterized protein LOC121416970 [Lytechinus variegatus]|uniref:uncharacterized protein LOC121416970 n=1 Tax=Lytechinus variegatus TaxID=7654 RepID=UPI001BB19C2B|nr:uncharacterized protein LOC121416970 [Lytechinus variegatus]
MFLTYINDMPDKLKCQARLFADDCLLYTPVAKEEDMCNLQDDLRLLEKWQSTWKMSFNPSKCTVLAVSKKKSPPLRDYIFCGQVLEKTTSHPYLGVQLDNKLTWREQVDKTANKAHKTLGFLRRNLWFCPRDVKVIAYKSLVRPVLEYATCAWDPYKADQIRTLEGVQRKAARFCCGDYSRESSVSGMLKDLQLDTLESRREKNRLAMMYKIQNNNVDINKEEYINLISTRETRNNSGTRIEVPFARTDTYKNSFFPRTIRAWNDLNPDIKNKTSVESFRATL